MAADVVIHADRLGKKYVIGHQAQRESYVSLREVIARNSRNLWRTATDIARGRPNVVGDELEEFWALREIDFEVTRGEVVGVIGRNGAGKSTLLKVLSRITEPTEGRVEIRGRVASLLEVGTGFHPELTGRENVYLNGAVLGMTHAEIRRKFDEIVAFAEVERFLDTPVKRYSSGMYVRLAFAVAAHLEPEILIVDEVLAVGDAEFQKKCLGKIGEVAGHGRTVLFVSHNMASVANLCPRSLLLHKGRIAFAGPTAEAISRHMAPVRRESTSRPGDTSISRGAELKKGATIVGARAEGRNAGSSGFVESGGPLTISVDVRCGDRELPLSVFICLTDRAGVCLAKFESDPKAVPLTRSGEQFTVSCEIPVFPFVPGDYFVGVGVGQYGDTSLDYQDDIAALTVTAPNDPSFQMSRWVAGHVATGHTWAVSSGGAQADNSYAEQLT